MIKDSLAKVKYLKPIGEDYFQIGLKVDWEEFTPGQFVMTKPPKNATFLRRPFGIVSTKKKILELCIKKVGNGTNALSELKTDECVKILGPLGNGFKISKGIKKAIIVAGGYGIAPLLPLAEVLCKNGADIKFLYGGKSSKDILYLDELRKLNLELIISTEDGSMGEKGLITEALKAGKIDGAVFCSGPCGLSCAIAKIAKERKLNAQISLDSYMACGIGVCLGCVIKKSNGEYARACKDGPVFNAEEIDFGGTVCNLT